MSEGKSPVGVNKSTNKTVSKVVSGAKTTMLKTGGKAKGKMHNFSKLAIKSAMKGYK